MLGVWVANCLETSGSLEATCLGMFGSLGSSPHLRSLPNKLVQKCTKKNMPQIYAFREYKLRKNILEAFTGQ